MARRDGADGDGTPNEAPLDFDDIMRRVLSVPPEGQQQSPEEIFPAPPAVPQKPSKRRQKPRP